MTPPENPDSCMRGDYTKSEGITSVGLLPFEKGGLGIGRCTGMNLKPLCVYLRLVKKSLSSNKLNKARYLKP
jgi:hypothetical protein